MRDTAPVLHNFHIGHSREREAEAREISRPATSQLRRAVEGLAAFASIALLMAAVIALRAYLYVPPW